MGFLYIIVFITMISSFSLSQAYAEPIVLDGDFIIKKFASGLEAPTTMNFIGDDILILEKNIGKVIRIQDNGILYDEPVLDVPIVASWESGLLGISSVSNHVFLYFKESESGSDLEYYDDRANYETGSNKIYQYDWDGEKLANPVLIKKLPNLSCCHHGGVIAKGLNNEIYFVIGDQHQRTTFQNIANEATYETGAIFKVNTDEENRVELFAIGIRNSFGLAVDPVTGYLWDTENGPDKFDEINLVKPGFNSGWKRVMGPVDRDNPDIDGPQTIPPPFENFVYSDPEFSFHQTVGPTAIAFPDDSFGYSDMLFVSDYNHATIYKFPLNSDRTGFNFSNPELVDLVVDGDADYVNTLPELFFAYNFPGGISDITFHNGVMYVAALMDGTIYKIYPIQTTETSIPDWIKNNAGWWATGQIDKNSYVLGLQWLITNGIIVI